MSILNLRRALSVAAASLVLLAAGCGSSSVRAGGSPSGSGPVLSGHPHVVAPVVGSSPGSGSGSGSGNGSGAGSGSGVVTVDGNPPVGDTTAHAMPLSEVRRELKQLNLCGGASSAADAQPIATRAGPGFVPDPGTIQDVGQLPELTARLGQLAQALGVVIYGISGYRSPSHSVAVGGFADDPHTRGQAEDIGVNSLLRSSAAQISEAELARFGLYRPFDPSDDPNNSEVNHVQLIGAGGPLALSQAEATFAPDPSCS